MITFKFKIQSNTSRRYINRWNDLKYKCEHGNTKELAAEWLQKCQLETNQALPFINRGGGVLGSPKKYISFRLKLVEWWQNDVFIVFNQIHASPPEKWELKELDDLRFAFQNLCNAYVLQTSSAGRSSAGRSSAGRVKANLVKGYLKVGDVIISS